MPGLFDKIGNAIQSPTGQGLLGAAALGLNPALGLLAAPALSRSRKRAEQEQTATEQALEAQAMEIAEAKRRRQAADRIPRLLGSAPPAVANIGGGATVPGQGQYQQRAIGLLSQVAPQAAAEGLLSQAFPDRSGPRVSSAIGDMQALGLPMTPQGFAEYQRLSGKGQMGVDDLLKRLQVEEIISERESAAETEVEQEQLASIDAASLLESGRAALANLDQLEGGFLEPGSFGMPVRRALASGFGDFSDATGLFTESGDAADRAVGASDKIKKDLADFVVSLARVSGANSATELNQIRDSFASVDSSPPAIRAATRREIRRLLARADAQGIEIPNREQFEALANGDVQVEFD